MAAFHFHTHVPLTHCYFFSMFCLFCRVQGILATSRALGDYSLDTSTKLTGISAEPAMSRSILNGSEEFLLVRQALLGVDRRCSRSDFALLWFYLSICLFGGSMGVLVQIACDGVWDVFTNEEAVQFIWRDIVRGSSTQEAVKRLVLQSVTREVISYRTVQWRTCCMLMFCILPMLNAWNMLLSAVTMSLLCWFLCRIYNAIAPPEPTLQAAAVAAAAIVETPLRMAALLHKASARGSSLLTLARCWGKLPMEMERRKERSNEGCCAIASISLSMNGFHCCPMLFPRSFEFYNPLLHWF